jgi:peptide/nickel transport system permease protein
MLRYIIKRLIYMVPTLFGMSIIAFLIIQLPPGDYLTSMIAMMTDSGQNVDPAQVARLREIYGFDDPVWLQYWKWMSGILFRGDFGYSFEWNRPVADLIWERMGSTVAISAASLLFVWAVSLPIGIYSAMRRPSVSQCRTSSWR